MESQFAVRHHEYGAVDQVLKLEGIERPVPAAGEVGVRMLWATINPSDFGMIGGSYGHLRDLPAIAGREAVGVVEVLGAGVSGVEVGVRVRFPEGGAWCEFACVAASELEFVGAGVPDEQAAVSFINPPTAYCLLRRVVDLERGDWVLQNAGNSAVGVAVIQMARRFGLRTISQVRRAELVEPLRELGADHVVVEGSGWEKRVAELTGGAGLRLALNSIGGRSAIDQIKALSDGGTQVTFGGMVGDVVRFPTRYLIFNDVRLVGFWWDAWMRREGVDGVRAVMAEVHGMMARGEVQVPIAGRYPLCDFAEAVAHAQRGRLGKVLISGG